MLCTAIAAPALAQEQPAKPTDQSPALQDIIVTAQKRAQNLQDVPISIAVVSGEQVDDKNIRSLQDLSRTLPALAITPSGRGVRVSVRGVASGTNTSLDQSVVTFIDDIYHGKGRGSSATLLDIDRIEVLKGPQTTYFGNNAIGGAISITSARPKNDWEGYARALYGMQGEYALEGVVNAPVSDTLAVRVAALGNGLNGYLNDRTGDGWVPHERNLAGRISALWKPTDQFQLYLKAEGIRDRNRGGATLQIIGCPPGPPFVAAGLFCTNLIADGGDGKLNNVRDWNSGEFLNLSTQDYQGTASYDFGPVTLTSVTGYSRMNFDNAQDLDGTPESLFGLHQPEHYHQFSQELRLASDQSGPLSYVVGAYYQTSRYDDLYEASYGFLSPTINGGAPFAALRAYLPFAQSITYHQNERTLSAFGSLTWRITDRLSITGGVRATQVKKDFDQLILYGQAANGYGYVTPFPTNLTALAQTFANAAALGTAGTVSLSRKDSKVLPTFNIQYKLTSAINVYASYTEGFKSGGFNGSIVSLIPSQYGFSPEGVKAYEIGVRSELFDRRLLLNVTGFHMTYQNLQVATYAVINGAPVSLVQNAASELSQGVEVETRFAASRSLSFGASLSFLDAHYKSYPFATSSTTQRYLTGARTQDLSGGRRVYSPKFAGDFYVNFKHPITESLDFEIQADVLHQSQYFTSDADDPNLSQPAYSKLDATISIASHDKKWEFSVIGRNLTNATILSTAFDAAGAGTYFANKERPRSVSGQIRYNW